jgi:hypothetical protein
MDTHKIMEQLYDIEIGDLFISKADTNMTWVWLAIDKKKDMFVYMSNTNFCHAANFQWPTKNFFRIRQ